MLIHWFCFQFLIFIFQLAMADDDDNGCPLDKHIMCGIPASWIFLGRIAVETKRKRKTISELDKWIFNVVVVAVANPLVGWSPSTVMYIVYTIQAPHVMYIHNQLKFSQIHVNILPKFTVSSNLNRSFVTSSYSKRLMVMQLTMKTQSACELQQA